MTHPPGAPTAPAPWTARRFALILAGVTGAGLAGLWGASPGRLDLMAAAATGAAFGSTASIAGYALIARQAAVSMVKAVQVFLAVMTVKVLAFAAFLLTIAFTTSLNPVALAGGLVGTTMVGEALAITSLRRVQGPGGDPGSDARGTGERTG